MSELSERLAKRWNEHIRPPFGGVLEVTDLDTADFFLYAIANEIEESLTAVDPPASDRTERAVAITVSWLRGED